MEFFNREYAAISSEIIFLYHLRPQKLLKASRWGCRVPKEPKQAKYEHHAEIAWPPIRALMTTENVATEKSTYMGIEKP